MIDDRKVPEGRLGRFARMASVGLRSGTSLLVSKDGDSAAKHAAEVFGTLRGLAAKVGQMASYVDGVVPEKHRDAYETAMKGLRAAAPTSSAAEIRAMVESELGAPIDRLFAAWNDAPLASASIGQVHHATLNDGRQVAVKVQHPGIVRAIDADLANAGMLSGLVTVMGGRRFNAKAQLEVVRARFREELDYRLEAERIEKFRAIHAGDETVRVLSIVADRCSTRVLTTEFVDGVGFDQACAASDEQKRAWAQTMWRFVFKGTLVGGVFNADPHPGNYIFHEGGAVTFLDFGCVQAIPKSDQRNARRMHRAAIAVDQVEFDDAARALIGMKPGELGERSLSYIRLCFQPLFHRPYRLTRPYASSLVEQMKELAVVARKAPLDEFFDLAPDMLFMNRLQFGFYSVLARFDVDVDYAAVEEAFLHLATG